MGGRPPAVTDDEIVEALEIALEETGDPAAFAKEIADHGDLDINYSNLNPRLKELKEEGRVDGKFSGNTWAWWLPDD